MSNAYYNRTGYPTPNAPGSSAAMRNELDLIMDGFDKLPTLTGNAFRVITVNSAGNALVATANLQSLAITNSTLNNSVIGGLTPAAGTFSTLLVNSTAVFSGAVTISSGTINGTQIGNTTASSGAFTTLSATSGISGNLTGNVTGNLTGNVTGNITGNITGNVTASSGSSTFNDVTINGTLDMNAGSAGTITGLSAPVNNTDATTKLYVDTGLALKLNLSGGTMSGNIAMGNNKLTGLTAPTDGGDSANKTYVDQQRDTRLALAGGTMTGAILMGTNRITGLGDPVNAQDAATKIYVDNSVQGLDAKASVRVATTGNITLSGTQTIDGVLVAVGNRVLVKDQNTPAQNGIYVVASGSWARAADADTFVELISAFTFVEDGTVNGDNGFVCTVVAGGTLGSTSITWVQFSGAGQIDAGGGLTKTGNQLNVGTASSSRIVVNADNLDLAMTAITAGTYRSLTIDDYGRATAGTNPTTISGYGITDAYTKTEVDNSLSLKLNLTGGTVTGNIAMSTNRITGLGDPSSAQDAATRNYVDNANALKLSLSGGTMTGNIAMGSNAITGLSDPTNAQDATTKNYVDGILGSATSAAASASAAAASELNAANSASAASISAGNALASEQAAASSFDSFDDRYLGAKSVEPTTDNDGDPLIVGALYFNTVFGEMRVWNGSAWLASYLPAVNYLLLSGGTMTGNITFAGTQTFPGTGDVTLTGTQTLTNKRIDTRSVNASGTSGTLTINGDTTDLFVAVGLTGAITFAQPSGTPVNGQKIMIRIKDNGTARDITWTTSSGAFRPIGVTLPTTTVINKVIYVGCVYNSTDTFWDVVALAAEA
jgi:hypothetical protein